jgi:hypothetical protein
MKKTKIKTLNKKYILQLLVCIYGGNVNSLLKEIKEDESRETFFWFACKNIAFEILSRDNIWYELANKLDYLAQIVEDEIIKNLPKWLEKEMSITDHLDSTETLAKWLFERYINTLKNTTKDTYKIFTRLDIVEFQDERSSVDEMPTVDKTILDSFLNYSAEEKVAILTKVWEDSWDDFDFDHEDLNYLCTKYGAPNAETFIDLSNQKVAMIQSKVDGYIQLSFDLEEQKRNSNINICQLRETGLHQKKSQLG